MHVVCRMFVLGGNTEDLRRQHSVAASRHDTAESRRSADPSKADQPSE